MSGVITVSRRKYAAGLFWQPVIPHLSARENAAQISKAAKVDASLFIQYGVMIGVISRNGGARAGMPVAAAEVMDSFNEQTFLSAFNVKEGVWVLAVRGGIVIRDKVFKNTDDAKRAYSELNQMPDWNMLVAPSDWRAPGAVERRMSDFMTGKNKHRLENISHAAAYFITAVLLFGFLVAGYVMFQDAIHRALAPRPHQLDIEPELIEEFQRRVAEIHAPDAPPPPTIVRVPMPWEKLPDLHIRADLCHHAIAFLSQPITGWVVNSVSCEPDVAVAHLMRNFGTIGDLFAGVQELMPNTSIQETGGSDVVLTAKLPPLELRLDAPAHSANEIMTAVQSVFQRIDAPVDFRREFYSLDLPMLGENEIFDIDIETVPIVKITVTTKLQPREFIKIMYDIHGIDMPLVKWDNRNRNWKYEVIIFVK